MNKPLPNYPWYQTGKIEDFCQQDSSKTQDAEKLRILQQGYLLFNCPVIDISNNYLIPEDLKNGEVTDIEISIEKFNLFIMTQSCDLANDKTDQVLLCAFFPASSFTNNELKEIKSNRRASYCLIEASDTADIDLPSFERLVIDFRQVYTLPKEYILNFIGDKTIVRLLPPYREYVAQAFARFFMRVGLPKDLL